MNELDFIAALRALPLHPGARELRDDAAVLEVGGETLVLTHDAIAEGIHYLPGTDPADVAWKLVAVNLSDLAAKGAAPLGVLIGATLVAERERFFEGLRAVLETYSVPLLGGDTIALGPGNAAVFGCTAIGRATSKPVPSRGGARPGDALWMAGVIGDAIQGYHAMMPWEALLDDRPELMWRQSPESVRERAAKGDPAFVQAYLRPRPLIGEGIALAPHVHAMMDVSDGLFLDAARMAEASGVTLDIEVDAVPFSRRFWETRSGNQFDVQSRFLPERLAAMRWGDDYALLFAAPPDAALPVPAVRIGHVLERGEQPVLAGGFPIDGPLGYEHR